MYIIDEKDLEYRHGDSGPKYLMKGPRMNFAIVQFPPGSDFKSHYHNVMEENFYVMEGEIDIIVDGKTFTLTKGQFIHVEPEETHYLINHSDKVARLVATLAPYQESDKVEVDS
ncbi:cupin domain-containing protein [Sinanaerobacter chloroacetimidivorans]|jgi:quercetin dioxygenase-like cupin family protein|uniref:Cupin domain-containing protein n=1 Tax=Sinanaerobacter chloroacetimidivorans TaxID=2818044 RepID=A0A8J8B1G8_9FIRM|nr:cupin domain-containing protein [Sinanaerobacter chloroacetimidivorans]MBR0598703.1 cupin domain-containing protein [Sinanaerobacter chloroacetimidivorans]